MLEPEPAAIAHRGWAVLAVVLFFPVGLISLSYSRRAQALAEAGDTAGAADAADLARYCAIAAAGALLLVLLGVAAFWLLTPSITAPGGM